MSDKNVHFRNLTAAHVDDDHGGCGQHSGPLRRGSPHVFVQNRPLVRQKDLPSCAGRPDHEPAAHCHVGEGGGSAVTTARRGGVQSAPRKKCTAAGHPVDVATGRVFTPFSPFASASPFAPIPPLTPPFPQLMPPGLPGPWPSLMPPTNPRPSGPVLNVFPPQHRLPPHAAAPRYSVKGFLKRVIGTDGHQGSFHDFAEDITGKRGPHGHMGALGAAQTFFNHIGNSLGDGVVGVYDHVTGDTDHEKAVLDDAKKEDDVTRTTLKGTLGGDDGLAATAAQAAADKWYAHQYPAAAGELNRDAAGQMAKAKAGVIDQAYNDPFGDLAMVMPVGGAGRLAALGRLSKALEAANAAGDGVRAARISKAMNALKGGKAGAALREAREAATKKLSAQGQATLAKGQAAVAKHQERQAAGRRDPSDPLEPHTLGSLAKASASQAQMHGRWEQQAHGRGTGHEQPTLAHAGNAPEGRSTRAIGKPSSMMQMVDGNGNFRGKLRGGDVTLMGVKTRPLTYTKRAAADREALRKQFESTARFDPGTKGMNPRPMAENRSNFLKGLANDPTKEAALKAAGIDNMGIALMKRGKIPDPFEWQVHHKLPLDDGGTNAPDNLVLMRNEPFHKVITNEQDIWTRKLQTGETIQLPSWPVPDGFVYPPINPAVP